MGGELSSSSDSARELTLDNVIGIVWAGRFIFILCVLFGLAAGVVVAYGTKPTYMATALLQIEDKQSSIDAFEGGLSSLLEGDSDGEVEIEVIKSRHVLGQVVTELGLQVTASFEDSFSDYFSFSSVITNSQNTDRSEWQRYDVKSKGLVGVGDVEILADSDPFSIVYEVVSDAAFKKLGSAEVYSVGEAVGPENGLSFKVYSISGEKGNTFSISYSRHIDAANALKEMLVVSERGKDTGVISLSLKGKDKFEVKNVLDSIVKVYGEQNVKRYAQEASNSIGFLDKQIPLVRDQLELAEDALNLYRSQNNSLDMALETKAALEKAVELDAQINALKLKEREIEGRYTKNHPVYVALLSQMDVVVGERNRVDLSVGSLPSKQQELLRLTRNVEVTNQIYLQLLGKLEELKIVEAGTTGNVRVLEHAEVLTVPVAPRKTLIVAVCVVVSLLFAMAIILLKNILSSVIESPNYLQEAHGLTNYGVIPSSKTQADLERRKRYEFLANIDKKDIALEALRSLRTSIHFAMMEASDNVVVISGPSPGIGKSFVCSNLAMLIGEAGQRVLLIDADMRRGHINKMFNLGRDGGLSEYLSGEIALFDAIKSNLVKNVDFISTGKIPPNPSELIMGSNFDSLLKTVREQYDVVLIDTPPTLAVTDAMLIGKRGGTLMSVIRHEKNNIKEINQMLTAANRLGVPFNGYIYNCMDFHAERYSGGDRYYNYGYYTMDESEE